MDVEVFAEWKSGAQSRWTLSADAGVVVVGRTAPSSLVLESPNISRVHARLDVRGAKLRVEDVSTNGTLAGDLFLHHEAAEVAFGTPIMMGDVTLRVARRRGAVATSTSTPTSTSTSTSTPTSTSTSTSTPTSTSTSISTSTSTPRRRVPAPPAMPAAPPPAGAPSSVELRREIHKRLLEHMDLSTVDVSRTDDPNLRPRVLAALRRIVEGLASQLPAGTVLDALVGELADEAVGLGPLERFLNDPSVSEIMVVDPHTIYVERAGRIARSDVTFTDDASVRAVVERIVTPLGRRIDESVPLVDARLRDGSRVNAVIRPLAIKGTTITIRKFARSPLTLERLVELGAMDEAMGRFLVRSVVAKKNIVISGGTGSGKTTLLNVLSGAIPEHERIVTIEDAAELRLRQPHVVSLETRPANMEGTGEYTIRDLVKNALRMRPDRIVVGECRGGEALDMLQAMNTGHDGSLTTTHANSPREAVRRLETLVLMAGVDLPVRAVREQIAGSVNLLVQQSRLSDGSRKVTAIAEVLGVSDEGEIELLPIFEFVRTGTGDAGKVVGEFRASGFLPTFLDTFRVLGLVAPDEPFL